MMGSSHHLAKCAAALLIGWLFLVGLPRDVHAQLQDASWSEPYPLSSGERQVSGASLVSDPYGYVHAFWSEQDREANVSILQYARFDGELWSPPIDLYVTTADYDLGAKSVTVDSAGRLHLAWSLGPRGPIYYMTAPAHDALSANSWTKPLYIDYPAWRVSLRVASDGKLHMLYVRETGDERGVYYTNSVNGGLSWQMPIWLDPDIPPAYFLGGGGMGIDANDGLHVLWHYLDSGDPAAPARWIRYTYSPDGGETWFTPSTIDRDLGDDGSIRVAGPLMAIHGNTIHVVWAGGEQPYRKYSHSEIGSSQWSAPEEKIFGDLSGQAGDSLTVDAIGRLHYIGQVRYPQGIYHAVLSNGRWSVPSLIYLIASDANDPIGDRIHAHAIGAAFRIGNQMVITFVDRKEEGNVQLYEMHKTLSDLPTLEPLDTPVAGAQPQDNTLPDAQGAHDPSPTPENPLTGVNTDALERSVSPADPIFIGLAAAVLLIGGAMGMRFLRRR